MRHAINVENATRGIYRRHVHKLLSLVMMMMMMMMLLLLEQFQPPFHILIDTPVQINAILRAHRNT